MRYGARNSAADREQLWALAAAAGIRRTDVVVERFLPHMEVVSSLPSPAQGLAGRPPVAVPGAQGLFLAGDWVGPQGWLSDGPLASGRRAGLLAAEAARNSGRSYRHLIPESLPSLAAGGTPVSHSDHDDWATEHPGGKKPKR